jgi:hypothetical protein
MFSCPTLFNLKIDPVIRYLRGNYNEFGVSYMMENIACKKIVQAYSDDLLEFTDSPDNLGVFINAICDFMRDAHIKFNPSKFRFIKSNSTEKVI